MVEIICIFGLIALLLAREYIFAAERKEWLQERGKLLDRVQAGSLMEYKQAEIMGKPKDKKERPKGVDFL